MKGTLSLDRLLHLNQRDMPRVFISILTGAKILVNIPESREALGQQNPPSRKMCYFPEDVLQGARANDPCEDEIRPYPLILHDCQNETLTQP